MKNYIIAMMVKNGFDAVTTHATNKLKVDKTLTENLTLLGMFFVIDLIKAVQKVAPITEAEVLEEIEDFYNLLMKEEGK